MCKKKKKTKEKFILNSCKPEFLHPLYQFVDVRGWGANDRRGMHFVDREGRKRRIGIRPPIQVFGASPSRRCNLPPRRLAPSLSLFSSFQPPPRPSHSFSSGTSVQFMDWFRKEGGGGEDEIEEDGDPINRWS